MRFYPDRPDVTTLVRWYRCADTAIPLPYRHRFSSRNWTRPSTGEDSLGETSDPPHIWYNGASPNDLPGTSTCTPEDAWFNGVPYGTTVSNCCDEAYHSIGVVEHADLASAETGSGLRCCSSVPDNFAINVSGITNHFGHFCTDANGSFTLPKFSETSTHATWFHPVSPHVSWQLTLQCTDFAGLLWKLILAYQEVVPSSGCLWQWSATGTCDGELELPFDGSLFTDYSCTETSMPSSITITPV